MQAKAGGTAGAGTSRDGVRREGRQGVSPARCPWDAHPPVLPAPAAAAHALHPPLTEMVLVTGYSPAVGWDKAKRFLYPPTFWRAAASFRSECHSFIWMMRNPSVPVVLSHELLFKQARCYISQTAPPDMKDQSEICSLNLTPLSSCGHPDFSEGGRDGREVDEKLSQ